MTMAAEIKNRMASTPSAAKVRDSKSRRTVHHHVADFLEPLCEQGANKTNITVTNTVAASSAKSKFTGRGSVR